MNSFNNNEIKKFLLKHKKEFQKYLNKGVFGFCVFCPLFKDTKEEIHYKNINCNKVYEYIALSLGKKLKSSLIIRRSGDCKDIYKEMISLASSVITITNE